MEGIILGIIGIAVSIVLFFIGYKETVGAKKERIKAVNDDIEKILVKRIILESYSPGIEDISRLVEGKSRDYKVKNSELFSESQFLNTIFSRLLETDFITPEKRNEIIERITPIILKAEKEPVEEVHFEFNPYKQRERRFQTLISILFGVFASIVGGSVSIFASYFKGEMFNLTNALAMTAISFSFTMVIYTFYKFREKQEESGSINPIIAHEQFEREVIKYLKKSKIDFVSAAPGDPFDFTIQAKGKKILVEVKNWAEKPLRMMIQQLVMRLTDAISKGIGEEAIIVTRTGFSSQLIKEDSKIKIMSIHEFKKKLEQFR